MTPDDLRDRIVMGSMHTGLEDRARDVPRLAAFYAERAAGGVRLIVTGGFAPDRTGWLYPGAGKLTTRREAQRHRRITEAVHEHGARILLQLLHAGRYGYHPFVISASASRSPISPFPARRAQTGRITRTIDHFARAAELAMSAEYDGVEIMGSEGYLLNQFLAPRTNRRHDRWGGSAENRRRLPVTIVERVRAAIGTEKTLSYRMSLLDLVPDGQSWTETVELAHAVERAGASMINTGIGWHESRVPTIVTSVPRAAFTDLTTRLRREVSIPVAASNRITTPEVARQILADGSADLVTMARPFLADPHWVLKATEKRADEINTCIGCNQACLDHTFAKKVASCLVNPRAGHETELAIVPTRQAKRVAVIGAGPAGLAAAVTAAERGHRVTLFEAEHEIGGQFRLARRIPGKQEFAETLRYFTRRLELTGVDVRLGTLVDDLDGDWHDVVLATGVTPRSVTIPGAERPNVHAYPDVVLDPSRVGPRVAVIGAGGVGVDVAELLVHTGPSPQPLADWRAEWGIGDPSARGGLVTPVRPTSARQVTILRRSSGRIGTGRTTAWVHRASLRQHGVQVVDDVRYRRIDDDGLHIEVGGQARLLDVTDVVVCAGSEPRRDLLDGLQKRHHTVHVIGGADVAAELDAKRAIDHATRLAARL